MRQASSGHQKQGMYNARLATHPWQSTQMQSCICSCPFGQRDRQMMPAGLVSPHSHTAEKQQRHTHTPPKSPNVAQKQEVLPIHFGGNRGEHTCLRRVYPRNTRALVPYTLQAGHTALTHCRCVDAAPRQPNTLSPRGAGTHHHRCRMGMTTTAPRIFHVPLTLILLTLRACHTHDPLHAFNGYVFPPPLPT